jgi:outer membrane receptor for ferrienterochelin and colicins
MVQLSWVAAALLMLGPAFAQEATPTIRVEVTSKAGPVDRATVTVAGRTAETDRSGVAVLAVTVGSVEIVVRKEGFLPARARIAIDQVREWPVAVELQPAETLKEEITVSATRTEARLEDVPTRVETLDHEEIEEKTMMTPGDIVMLLNEMGGLRVQTTSPSLGAASVRIQGMRGRYTRFLADGLPLFGQEGGGLGLLQIPPVDLGQVEVIKGNAAALYGAGAMAGVVDLISRRPAKEPIHELLLNQTTRGATDVSLFLGSQLTSSWSGTLLASGDFQTRNDVDHDGWADLAGYGRGVLRPRLFWNGSGGQTAFLTGGVTYENRTGGTIDGAVLPQTGQTYREALDTRRYDAGGSYQLVLGGKYVVTARFAGSSQHHSHQFGDVLERDRHDLLFGEVTARGNTGRQTWVIGAAGEREAFRLADVPRFAYTYVTPAVFGQDDFAIAPWLSLSASARADFHNRYGTLLSPRLAVLVRGKGWTSRASVGQGYFAPTPLTEETEAAGLSRLRLAAPLVAERGRSASFDLTRSVGALSATMTLFASSVLHPIVVSRTAAYELSNAPQPTNNRGVELVGTWRKQPLSITGTYSYLYTRQFDPEFPVRVEAPLTPRQNFGLTGMWENDRLGRFGAECYYTGRQRLEDNPYRTESKPYVSIGFLVEHRFGPLRAFFNAENLTDSRQSRWDPILRPNRDVDGRWTVDAWAPLEGRVFNGGVRFAF